MNNKPKQLNTLKDKIRGEKTKQFKLGEFQMKVYLEHTSPLHSEQNCGRRDRDNRLDPLEE